MLKRFWPPAPKYISILFIAAILLTATAGSLLGVSLGGGAIYDMGGLSLRLTLEPAWHGSTVLDLAPFGSITAPTHQTPLRLHVQLNYIGTELAQQILSSSDDQVAFLTNLRDELPQHLYKFGLQQLAAAFAGAFLLVMAIFRPRLKQGFLAALAAVLIVGLLMGHVLKTYDIQAFQEPAYTGVISLAAEVLPGPDHLLSRLDEVESQTRLVVGNIRQLFTSVNGLSMLANPEQDDDMVKLLLVGDMHSNPVGVEFIKELASNFKVMAVIDTGDLTDFGSPLETRLAEGLGEINVPYVFAPENHDSPDSIAFVRGIRNSIVLEGQIEEAAGLKILGSPDPLSAGTTVATDPEEWNQMLQEQANQLLKLADQRDEIDLVVVHDPRAARYLAGTFSLMVTGHTHQQNIQMSQGSIILNPGSTGAAGVRGLYADQTIPYSAIILYIKPGQGAMAADTIKYDPLSDRFYMERKMLTSSGKPDLQTEDSLASKY